jgi:hypothetical protein
LTVGELRTTLAKFNDNLQIIIQDDCKGYSFHEAYGCDLAIDDESYVSVDDEENLRDYYGDDIPQGRVVVIV